MDKPADGFSEQENYSLAPEAFHLPAIAFTDGELAALQTALSLLDGEFAYAEPLRLALQQITWGRPSPLDSPAQRSIGLGITGVGGRRRALGAPGEDRHRDLPPQADRVRVLHDADGRDRAAQGRPLPAAVRGRPVLPRRLVARARGRSASSASRASAARSPTRPRPSTTSSAPTTSTRASTPTASRGSSATPSAPPRSGCPTASPGTSSATSAAYGDAGATPRTAARVFRTAVRHRAPVIAWALGYGEHARVLGPPELADELHRRLDRIAELHRGEPSVDASPRGPARPRAPDGRGRAPRPRPREAAAIRPERFARLVTLASVLIEAGRAGQRLRVADVCEQLQMSAQELREDVARAQRRQLRRRRLRALRRGPARRRDRGRPRALLRHLRPPRPPAADRGPGAGGRDRPARRPPVRGPR